MLGLTYPRLLFNF
jgi:hypothetical protein